MHGVAVTGAEQHPEPTCPRCGYDLRGLVRAWDKACPLEGTCTECGLEFEWSKVLRPERYEPRWCVEFAPHGTRSFIISSARTMGRTLWPWGFWKRLNMALEVRWRRLAGYVGFLLVVLLVMFMVQQAAVAIQVRLLIEQNISQTTTQFQTGVKQTQKLISELESLDYEDATSHAIENEMMPEGFRTETLTESERDARVEQLKPLVQRWKRIAQTKGSVNHPIWRAVVEAVFTPWSITSSGTINDPLGGTIIYPPPRDLHRRLIVERPSQTTAQTVLDSAAIVWIAAGVFTGAYFVLMPVLFVLLPMSRRRAKVRWAHVCRAAVYSAAIPVLGGALWLAIVLIAFTVPPAHAQLMTLSRYVVFLPVVMLMAWWATAMSRYMMIPRGWFVVIVFAVLTVLLLGSGAYLLGMQV